MKKLIGIFVLLFGLQYICGAHEVKVDISVHNGEEKFSQMLLIDEKGDTLENVQVKNSFRVLDLEEGKYYKFVFTNGEDIKIVEILEKTGEGEYQVYHYHLCVDWKLPYSHIKL